MDLTLTRKEIALLAECISSIGTSDFPARICQLLGSICKADNVYLTVLFDDRSPVALYGNHDKPSQRRLLDRYLEAAYLLDPFVLRFRKKLGDQVLALDEIAPDDFKQSEYFSRFFGDMGLTDECGMLLSFGDDAALFFSMGYEKSGASAELDRLKTAYPVTAALARRHWANLSRENTDGSGRLAAHLERAFEDFGSSVLSPREGEIVRMVLRGHSSKAIANALDNSPETIKVHRKRIYAKLGITSQGELLSTFLTALTHMPATGRGDPLLYLASTNPNG